MTGAAPAPVPIPETAPAPRSTEPVRTPAPRPALTNRAAGGLRERQRAESAAPVDVGLEETRYDRTAEDDADLRRVSRPVVVPSPRRPSVPRPRVAAPADVGLDESRAERTAQDEAEVRAASAPIVVASLRRPLPGTDRGAADAADADGAPEALTRSGVAPAGAGAAAGQATRPAPTPGPPATRTVGPSVDPAVPTTAAGIRARTEAAVTVLPHPQLTSAAAARAPLDSLGTEIADRADARTRAARQAPAAVVGPGPVPGRRLPREDSSPVQAQLDEIKAKSGIALAGASLPPVTPSPRGTLPEVAGPVLRDDQLRNLRIGESAISLLTDPAEQAQLRALRAQLTATTTAPAPDAVTGAAPLAAVPIQDEPVAGVALTPAQRAMFTQAVGELQRDPADAAHRILVAIRIGLPAVQGGALQREFPELGQEEETGLRDAIQARTAELAAAIALTPDEVQAATKQRREELAAQEHVAAEARAGAAGDAVQVTLVRADATTRTAAATAAHVERAVRADARATQGRRPNSVQARVERTLGQIRDLVSTGIAAYDTQQHNREHAIADAVRRQVAAYRFAQTRDEIALGRSAQAADIRRWADTAIAALQDGPDSAKERLVATALGETRRRQKELSDAGGAAFQALHDWGARQSTATQEWWTTLDTGLQTWAKDATARAAQWRTVQGEQTRLALTQDLAAIHHMVALQQAGDRAAVRDYANSLDGETRKVVETLGNGGDLASALATGVHARVRAALQPGIETRLTRAIDELTVKDDNRKHIDNLVAALQGGQSIFDRASDIHASVTRWRGFDEGKIFRAMTGMTVLGSKLLRVVYYERFGQSLQEALEGDGHVGHLNKDELHTAQALMEGDIVAGSAGALRSAIEGLGTDLDEVRRVLRTLSPQQRVQALQIYRDQYGETLTTSLSDEWISRSQTEETTALAAGDLRGADAIVLGRAVVEMQRGGGEGVPPTTDDRYVVIDRSGASEVYDGIRQEVEAEGARQHWTTNQVEAEIALRNQETEAAFNTRYADRWWAQEAPDRGALRTAFSHDSEAGSQLLSALADNDRTAADAARLRIEDSGVWAEDAAINAVMHDQHARALAEVNRDLGPVLSARVDAQLNDRERDHPFATEAERRNERLRLERESARTLNQVADERTRQYTDALDTRYQQTAGRNLAAMIEDNMSGWSRREARATLAGHGVLTDYERIRYAIKGAGTDVPTLRRTLSTMSREDIEKADALWRADNEGESLLEAVHGDTSGREEGDLVDLVEHGAPQTVEEQAAAVRRRFERDRADERSPGVMYLVNPGVALAGGQSVGAMLTGSEIATARREVESMEADLAQMHKTGLTRDQQQSAGAHFDIALANAESAIEFQRNAVDAWANLLSTVAAIIAAVVVGLVLAPFTAGGSGVVAAAVITSLVATGVSMVTKALVKGGAYGAEEIMTDLAVGAVDAIASALTAGLAHGLLGRVTEVALPAGRSAVLQGAERIGRAGAVGGAKSGLGGFLARFGSRGPLAAAVEGRGGLLASMAAETSPLYQRLAARGAAHLVEQTVQTLPSQFAASMLDERTWRDPGALSRVLHTTAEGTVHSLGMGIAVGGVMHGVQGVVSHFRDSAPPPHLPANDVLTRMGTPQDRLREFRAWQRQNPDGRYADFYTERQQRAINESVATDADRARVRDARRELLAGLDPAQRGAYADLPILLAGEGEFREHGGSPDAAAHLLVEDGWAVLLLRDGAPPSALGGMLPAIQERVFARSGGLTLEGALPAGMRENVTVRRVPDLTTDTVRVVPIPPEGAITGIEVQVGPRARPIDVALHAGEVERVRGWTGLIGDARTLAARLATKAGFDVISPLDRARFEAAGEVGKLGPVIEDRVRRWIAAGDDVPAARRIEAEIRDQIAQLDRARRILSGELVAEPRGYVAVEGLPVGAPDVVEAPAPPADRLLELLRGRREVSQLRQLIDSSRRTLADAESGRAVDAAARDVITRLQEIVRATGGRLDFGPLAGLDLRALRPSELGTRSAQRKLARFVEANRRFIPQSFQPALARLEMARAEAGALRARLPDEIVRLQAEHAAAEARQAQREALDKPFNDVTMSSQLPEPLAGWEYRVEDIRGETAAQRESHRRGFQGELHLANGIQTNQIRNVGDSHMVGRQQVVSWGHKVTEHGADVISVDEAGNVFLWDSKYVGSGARHPASDTFANAGTRANAIKQAVIAISRSDRLTPAAQAQAIANIRNRNFTAITISYDGKRFHGAISQDFRGGRPAP